MKRVLLITLTVLFTTVIPAVVFAAPTPALLEIHARRPDLQKAFDPVTGRSVPGSAAGFLIDLEDWAHQYGWKEYPELKDYTPAQMVRRVLKPKSAPPVTAEAYLVMDWKSGTILASKKADSVRSIASLTKLMTADITLDAGVPLESTHAVTTDDDVGGAKLRVASGELFTLDDLLYATLAASANNAANALARGSGMERESFISEMNRRADTANLQHTHFVEPSGIDPANVSTAREIARLAEHVFARPEVRRYTSTARHTIYAQSSGQNKEMINTNWLLRLKKYNDVYVTAGKTGYLDESAWNVVTTMRPSVGDETRELLVVVLGAGSRSASFDDVERLAQWTWREWKWTPEQTTRLH